MCWCTPEIKSTFCGAADCQPPEGMPDLEDLMKQEAPKAVIACSHLKITLDRKVQQMVDTGRTMLHLRVTCADCKTPFMFQGLPKGLNLDGAATDLTGRVGLFSLLAEGTQPRDTSGPKQFTHKEPT